MGVDDLVARNSVNETVHMYEFTALSENEFQSLMVLLYISVLVVITVMCLLCPDLDCLVLITM